MDDDFLTKTEEQEWIQRRVSELGKHYTAFQALTDYGIEIPDEDTSYQILCPFHGDKNNPSARYYAPSGINHGHFWCFKCKIRLDGVGLYSKLNGKKFLDALSELERKYSVVVPKRPEFVGINPSDRNSGYVSDAWSDIPRFLEILEKKLIRNKKKSIFIEYVKVCRLLDNIRWDFNKSGKASSDMVAALHKASDFIDSWNNEVI